MALRQPVLWMTAGIVVHAEALGLNPLENGVEGVSQLPEKRLELFAICKRKKKEKNRFFLKEAEKRFPLDHTFSKNF